MPKAKPGKVYLTGAGPGDPSLLTVYARDLLASADLILHDGLVPSQILNEAGTHAEVQSVAKRAGAKSITQDEIHDRMVGAARSGKSVVRLKVGDPMLFGRGTEELRALESAGIPVEVVPGITAATAAAAAIRTSLTAREGASSVLMMTGHRAAAGPMSLLPASFAESTLVIYMPGTDYAALAGDLVESGVPESTPCAVVSQCSLPDQTVIHLTLRQLTTHAALPAPALVIVGRVLETH
jgi:uroporphyrin-III C-methyltransferase